MVVIVASETDIPAAEADVEAPIGTNETVPVLSNDPFAAAST